MARLARFECVETNSSKEVDVVGMGSSPSTAEEKPIDEASFTTVENNTVVRVWGLGAEYEDVTQASVLRCADSSLVQNAFLYCCILMVVFLLFHVMIQASGLFESPTIHSL